MQSAHYNILSRGAVFTAICSHDKHKRQHHREQGVPAPQPEQNAVERHPQQPGALSIESSTVEISAFNGHVRSKSAEAGDSSWQVDLDNLRMAAENPVRVVFMSELWWPAGKANKFAGNCSLHGVPLTCDYSTNTSKVGIKHANDCFLGLQGHVQVVIEIYLVLHCGQQCKQSAPCTWVVQEAVSIVTSDV